MESGRNARYCKPEVPVGWTIHQTFNITLLESYLETNLKRQVVEIEADDVGWEMESVIASRPSNDDPGKQVYLVKWEGYSHDKNMWKTYEYVMECSLGLLKDYYGQNPAMQRDGRYGKKMHSYCFINLILCYI